MVPLQTRACLFCDSCPESLNHLFFECTYANEVWCSLKKLADINLMPDKWEDIANTMTIKKHNKSIRSLLLKFILASCVYSIWTERNRRLFTNEKQDYKEMVSNVVNYDDRMGLHEGECFLPSDAYTSLLSWSYSEDVATIWIMLADV
ncbi:hypothetical protein Tco_0226300 [Tanacetum coccineum]